MRTNSSSRIALLASSLWITAAMPAMAQDTLQIDSDDMFGSAVAVGDFNGDGRSDLAVGVPGQRGGSRDSRSGLVLTFQGSDQGLRPWSILNPSALGAPASGDRFGIALAAGDFNDDGRDDLAIGAPGAAVVAGVMAPPPPPPGNPRRMDPLDPGPPMMPPMAPPRARTRGDGILPGFGVGRFDTDEMSPFMPGPGFEPPSSNDSPRSGVVFVFRGTANGLVPSERLEQEQGRQAGLNVTGDDFGASLAAGDFDRDGQVDLAVGVPNDASAEGGPRSGSVLLFLGTRTGFTAGQTLGQPMGMKEPMAQDRFGSGVVAADFDGDGTVDLAVSSPGKATNEAVRSGVVVVFRGTVVGVAAAQVIDQGTENLGTNETGDNFGAAMAVGDFNGDRVADLAIGTPSESPGDDPRAGFVFVFSGSPDGLHAAQGLEQEMQIGMTNQMLGTNTIGDGFGFALTAGDFDGDRISDLAVGAPSKGEMKGPRCGFVFLFRGSIQGLRAQAKFSPASSTLDTDVQGDMFGFGLATADLDGDGRADLIVGAPGKQGRADGTARAGAVYSFSGTQDGLLGAQRLDEMGSQDIPRAAGGMPGMGAMDGPRLP